jgi:hypothetical protein
MAQLWKVRLPGGNVVTPGEWTTAEPLYSTVEIAAGPFPAIVAFSYGRGGTVPGSVGPRQSTLVDTNLDGEGNRLPENEELVIHTIGVSVFKIGPALQTDTFPDADNPHVPLPDMLRLQRDLLMLLSIAAVKEYTRTPVSYWPGGMGVASMYSGGVSNVSGGTNGEIPAVNGSPTVDGRRELASELYIAGGEGFQLTFRSGLGQVQNLNLAANSRLRLRCYLDGYRRRPVA